MTTPQRDREQYYGWQDSGIDWHLSITSAKPLTKKVKLELIRLAKKLDEALSPAPTKQEEK